MKKINLEKMEILSGNGDGQDFVNGFVCVGGILMAVTGVGSGVGLLMAALGCSTSFGNW